MATTIALRPGGPSTALSVGATSHAAQLIQPTEPSANYASFLNTGTTTIYIRMQSTTVSGTCPAAVVLADTVSDTEIVLPPSMQQPVVYATPMPAFNMTAIGSAAGPSLIIVQPLTAI